MLAPGLHERVRTEEFWSEFLFVDEDASAPWQPWRVVFATGASRWSLELSADATGYVRLSLVGEGRCSELAWDDLAHWHPHLLRWAELGAVSRSIEQVEPRLAHPGVTLLLLARFAPVVTDEDATEAIPLIAAAWRRVGVASSSVQQRLLQIIDLRRSGAAWQQVPELGWCLKEDRTPGAPWAYSLRVEGNHEFPWREWLEFTSALGVPATGE